MPETFADTIRRATATTFAEMTPDDNPAVFARENHPDRNTPVPVALEEYVAVGRAISAFFTAAEAAGQPAVESGVQLNTLTIIASMLASLGELEREPEPAPLF